MVRRFLVLVALMLPMVSMAQDESDAVFGEDKVKSYWYDKRFTSSGQNNTTPAYQVECGHGAPFSPEGSQCYVQTQSGVAGWRRSSNMTWILFLSIVDPNAIIYDPHFIQDDFMGRPYAGLAYPLTNPLEAPPPLCLSAFGCGNM